MRLYAIFFFFIINSFKVFSQDTHDDEIMGRFDDNKTKIKKSAFSIKGDVLMPFVNPVFYNRETACLSLEQGFNRRHAFQLTGQYGFFLQKNFAYTLQPIPGGPLWYFKSDLVQVRNELILDYKYYLKDSNDFKGFYCGLYIRGIQYTNRFTTMIGVPTLLDLKYTFIGLCAGATGGYQVIIKKHFVFDFLIGLGLRNVVYTPRQYDNIHVRFDADIPEPLRTYRSIDIRTTINIGYKF